MKKNLVLISNDQNEVGAEAVERLSQDIAAHPSFCNPVTCLKMHLATESGGYNIVKMLLPAFSTHSLQISNPARQITKE
jgi:hypothetical protein